MSKKDDEIARLKNKYAEQTEKHAITLDKMIEAEKENKELLAKNVGLTDNNQQLNNQIEELTMLHATQIKAFQEKLTELSEYKPLMIVTVNITGVPDIGKTLDDAVTLLTARLEALGLKDKYTILAVPHTMSIGISR